MKEIMKSVCKQQANQLLHNKFVVVLGDSIQRSIYKDLVLLLQEDKYLTRSQLKTKGELSFEKDSLVEGGCLGPMNNGTGYREVRQHRTDHHLVRFYFLTRIYSRYMETVLEDIRNGPKPDLVLVNSCVWDISRYDPEWGLDYRANLGRFMEGLCSVLPKESLVIWNLTMPLGQSIRGGFLVPERADLGPTLRHDVIEANFYSGTLADAYGLDVLDLHFHFRFSLQHRMKDGVHWNGLAHRRITTLLLQHVAQAWGVVLPCPNTTLAPSTRSYRATEGEYTSYDKRFCEDTIPSCPSLAPVYLSFEEDQAAALRAPGAKRRTPLAPANRSTAPGKRTPSGPNAPVYLSFEEDQAAALRAPGAKRRTPLAPANRSTAPGKRTPSGPNEHPDATKHQRTNENCSKNTGIGVLNPAPAAYVAPPPRRRKNQYVMRNRHAKRNHAPYSCQRPQHHQDHHHQYHPNHHQDHHHQYHHHRY